MRRTLLAAACLSASLDFLAPARAADYRIDPTHSHVLFLIDHLGFAKMIGLFTDFSGTISFDPGNVAASKLTVAIRTASLQTQFTSRDNDLKGADWFNVAEFPEMTFVGTSFAKKDDRSGTVTGNLTLLGVTRPVTLEVVFNKEGLRASDKKQAVGFSARGMLKRSDFGMKTFLPYIGDQVDLVVETEAIR